MGTRALIKFYKKQNGEVKLFPVVIYLQSDGFPQLIAEILKKYLDRTITGGGYTDPFEDISGIENLIPLLITEFVNMHTEDMKRLRNKLKDTRLTTGWIYLEPLIETKEDLVDYVYRIHIISVDKFRNQKIVVDKIKYDMEKNKYYPDLEFSGTIEEFVKKYSG